MTEAGNYTSGLNLYAWTGIADSGDPGFQTCLGWTSQLVVGWNSKLNDIGAHWPPAYPALTECTIPNSLYCLSDSDLLFHDGME